MIRNLIAATLFLSTCAASCDSPAAATVGQAAPEFTLSDIDGKTVTLGDFNGKYVVLEWHSTSCPFVKKHYWSGNMQSLQRRYEGQDTVWLTINSSNPEHEEYKGDVRLKAYVAEQKAAPYAYLSDTNSAVASAYGAKTTPHMFVINPAGVVVYSGAIDDTPSTRLADVKTAKNYVVAALEESRAGKPVSVARTPPYGCAVAYR